MTVHVGILLALGCALLTNLGFLYKHRGACAARDVDWRRPVHSIAGLVRSRWFVVGWLVALLGWCLHVGSLALAPLSVVQTVLAGGLVFLAVLAEPLFGFGLGRRQWAGVALTAVGLMLLVVVAPPTAGDDSSYSLAA